MTMAVLHSRACPTPVADGFSCLELVMVLAIASLTTSLAVPAVSYSIDAARSHQAAGFVAARVHVARQRALVTAHTMALVFDTVAGRWVFRVCEDGNGNGLRRAELLGGPDVCAEGPYDLAQMFPGTRVAVDPVLPGPEGEPGSADAVRFGRSDIVSFSPEGTGTAGTLFLRSANGRQYAIRVSNVTGRTRVLRYDSGTGGWIAG